MKKKLIAAVCAAMLTVTITACGAANNNQSQGNQSGNATITEEEAKEIALKDAGKEGADVQNMYVHLGNEDGVKVYEVEFYLDNQEYDYEIDAADGIIRSKDTDAENVNGNEAAGNTDSVQNATAAITEADAKKTALAKVEGAAEADMRMHLETDDGIQQYTGSIVYKERQYDFAIDATSGAVIEWEEESIYDD